MTNGKNYRETRRCDSGHTIVKFYFVTRCFSEHVQSILDEVKQFPPHVVIMNSCLWDLHRYGLHGLAAFKVNLGKLMFALNSTLDSDCVFIWNATLPLASKCKGGFLLPLFDTIPSLEIMEANFFVRNAMNSSKRLFLDLHAIFSQQLHHRAKDGVHWDKVAHRRITNLLLTELSRLWNVAVPRRTHIEAPRPSPNSWGLTFQPVTPTRSALLPTPCGLLPTPPSRNSCMINCNYTSLLGQMFRPATPDHPLSASFSGQVGFFNKYIVESGALSDGNDYEDVETARDYKQKFRFGASFSPIEKTNTAKNHHGITSDQSSGSHEEKLKSDSKSVDPEICVDREDKQSSETSASIAECPASVGILPAVQADTKLIETDVQTDTELIETHNQTDTKLNETDTELDEKTRELESDVQLDIEYIDEKDVKLLPRSNSFTCTPLRSSSSDDTSDLYTEYYRDAEDCEVNTELVDNRLSFSEEPMRSSTPFLARQPTTEQDVPDDSHSNQQDIDLSCSEPLSVEERHNNGTLSDCSDKEQSMGGLPVEKKGEKTISSSLINSGDSNLCERRTCCSTENTSVQLECDSSMDAITNTPVMTSQEELLSMKDSHCANVDKTSIGKDIGLEREKDACKPKTQSDMIQSLSSRGKKRKYDTLEENSRHKKMVKTVDGSKLKVESPSPKKVRNKSTSEKVSGHKERRRTEECREHKTSVKSLVVKVDTTPHSVQGELQGRSEKRQRNKDRHRKIASRHTSAKTCQDRRKKTESSSTSTTRNSRVASSTRHISSGRTGTLKNRESKKIAKQDVVSKNVASHSGNVNIFSSEKKQEEESLPQPTECVSDGRRATSDVPLKERDATRGQTTCRSYSNSSEIRDRNTRPENGQPVPVLGTNRRESSCFRKPENPPYKATQSRQRVSQSYRYNPYQYQRQPLNQQCIQQYQQYQQLINYSCIRNSMVCQPQVYSGNQQRAGNMYINANHPAMRQTVAEWERLMSFYAHNRYY